MTRLKCPICADDVGTIPPAQSAGDAASPREKLADAPCGMCVEYMKQGVILVSVRDGETGQNPYRTGCMAVVKDEVIHKIVVNEAARAEILRKRCAFVEDRTWNAVGLPRRVN